MAARAAFLVIALFWVTMNVLLWRAEFGGGRETVSDLPVETVVERVLNAADASMLTLYHHRERLGQGRFSATVIEGSGPPVPGEVTPEGMIRSFAGYRLDGEMNVFGEAPTSRWRIVGKLELDANRGWETGEVRLIQRPVTWTVSGKKGEDRVHVRFDEGRMSSEQIFSAADIPQFMAMAGPLAPILGGKILNAPAKAGPLVTWRASNDWLKVGRSRVRAYCIRGRALGKFDVSVYFNRAGEVLKVTLPDGYRLVNEALPSMAAEGAADAGKASAP
jgi:hypothetical protein